MTHIKRFLACGLLLCLCSGCLTARVLLFPKTRFGGRLATVDYSCFAGDALVVTPGLFGPAAYNIAKMGDGDMRDRAEMAFAAAWLLGSGVIMGLDHFLAKAIAPRAFRKAPGGSDDRDSR